MSTTKKRKKISVESVKLSDKPEGFTFSGAFKGVATGRPFQQVDQKTGEIRTSTLNFAVFEDLDSGERRSYVADAGLLSALDGAMVKEGDKIEVVKMKKQNIGKGRTMNSYDVFSV